MAKKLIPADKSTDKIAKGVSNSLAFSPGVNQAPSGNNMPEQALSVAGLAGQYNSVQPSQAYELSIPVRAAVSAITTQIAKMSVRIWDRYSGDEVVDGPLVDLIKRPAKGWTTSKFLHEISSFSLISGEIAINLLLDNTKSSVIGMLPLAPPRLRTDGRSVKDVADINYWFYYWDDGTVETIYPDSIIYAHNFNPNSHIRGLSLLQTGVNEATCAYFGMKYNKSFYENNCVPSHLLILPGKTTKKQRDSFEEKYLEQFNTMNNRSQKVMVVSGDDIKVQKIESEIPKDGAFLQLMQFTNQQIAMLFKVPASEMGLYDKTRDSGDSLRVERVMFLENTILPHAGGISEVLQDQLVDRYFTDNKHMVRGKGLKLKKALQKQLDLAVSQRISSRYIILLDPDSIPLMAQIQTDKMGAVKAIMESAGLSANEACEYLNIEIPYSPLRDKIYVSNTWIEVVAAPVEPKKVISTVSSTNIKVDEIEEEEVPESTEIPPLPKQLEDQTVEEPVNKALVHKISKSMRSLRKMAMIKNESDKLFRLSEADALFEKSPILKGLVRQIHRDIKVQSGICTDKVQVIKTVFNYYSKHQNVVDLSRKIVKSAMGKFVANPACCPKCAELDGKEYPLNSDIEKISHPNCLCAIE